MEREVKGPQRSDGDGDGGDGDNDDILYCGVPHGAAVDTSPAL